MGSASQHRKKQFSSLISNLLSPNATKSALHGLTDQPGIDVVMATKIYRFCVPNAGAAIDRHCSYFFNSLQNKGVPGPPSACTNFRREWATGKHRTSRLATFSKAGREWNLNEHFDSYLPLLSTISDALNQATGGFECAASHCRKTWRAADVEMAANQWWSRHGPR